LVEIVHLEEDYMKSNLLSIISLIIITILLSACGSTVEPTVDMNLAGTQAAQTVEAVLTEQAAPTAGPVEPTATQAMVILPTETATSLPPTNTPAPTNTPEATTTGEPCENKAKFVEDISIPDDTIVLPGQAFDKTWRLKNIGTCTWKTSYALFFVEGDLMGATSPSALTSEVPPGQESNLTVQFKSPGTPGTYRSDWTLLDTNGVKIGLEDKPEATFWVQIVVQEGTDALNLGTPTGVDSMDDSDYWYTLSTDNTEWEFENGMLQMKAMNIGEPEEWGLSNKAAMTDYFLQATFKTGAECAGLDRYGLLARAPDPSQGYVYEASCDGRYRLYKWDGETYSALQEWKSSSVIKAGSDQTNILGIWMQGKTIRLYLNNILLAEFEDDMFDEGRFGLVIGASKTEGFITYVDEVAYWTLGD
jgi:hypothetical protein